MQRTQGKTKVTLIKRKVPDSLRYILIINKTNQCFSTGLKKKQINKSKMKKVKKK